MWTEHLLCAEAGDTVIENPCRMQAVLSVTEVTQHGTRFEKGHGTCHSDRVLKNISKDVAPERCRRGQERLAEGIGNGHLRVTSHQGWRKTSESSLDLKRGLFPVKRLRVQADAKHLLTVGGMSVAGLR